MEESYATTIFKKTFEDITLDDIRNYFQNEQDETAIIEFKSGEVQLEGVYREIAAFLNTEGGLLFIGAPKEQKRKVNEHEIVYCKGDLTFSKFKSKDWLFQKISTNVFPVSTKIWIKEFPTDQGVFYLIDVPQSINPPHQVSGEGRYYIRMDRRAVPAPHGLVQALFNKRKLPDLEIRPTVKPKPNQSDHWEVTIFNESSIPGEKVSLMYEIYGVSKVMDHKGECKTHHDSQLGLTYTGNYIADLILPRFVILTHLISISHNYLTYLVKFTIWCRDTDSKISFFTYNPLKKEITEITAEYQEVFSKLAELWRTEIP